SGSDAEISPPDRANGHGQEASVLCRVRAALGQCGGERQGLKRKPDSIRAPHEKRVGDKLYTARSPPELPEPGVARPVIRRKCRLPDALCADKWCCANLQRDGIQPAGSGGLRRC